MNYTEPIRRGGHSYVCINDHFKHFTDNWWSKLHGHPGRNIFYVRLACRTLYHITTIFRYAAGKVNRSVWELVGGIAGILFGGFIIVNAFGQFAANMVIAYAAALWLLIYGITGIVEALNLRKMNQELPDEFRTASWLVVMILGVSTAVIGVVCIFQPMITMLSVGLLVGVSILISGIKTLILSIQIIKAR